MAWLLTVCVHETVLIVEVRNHLLVLSNIGYYPDIFGNPKPKFDS